MLLLIVLLFNGHQGLSWSVLIDYP